MQAEIIDIPAILNPLLRIINTLYMSVIDIFLVKGYFKKSTATRQDGRSPITLTERDAL